MATPTRRPSSIVRRHTGLELVGPVQRDRSWQAQADAVFAERALRSTGRPSSWCLRTARRTEFGWQARIRRARRSSLCNAHARRVRCVRYGRRVSRPNQGRGHSSCAQGRSTQVLQAARQYQEREGFSSAIGCGQAWKARSPKACRHSSCAMRAIAGWPRRVCSISFRVLAINLTRLVAGGMRAESADAPVAFRGGHAPRRCGSVWWAMTAESAFANSII